jgi:hypothetical protein
MTAIRARSVLMAVIPALTLASEARLAAPSQQAYRPPPTVESARVARDLRHLGYTVRDSAGTQGHFVLVLGDVHDPAITGATLRGIDSLRTVFAYDVVGFENFDHDFGNLTESGSSGGRLKANYESLLARAGPGLVEWANTRSKSRGPSSGPQVARFLEGHRGVAFGLERGDSSMLFIKAAYIYGELLKDAVRAATDSAATFDAEWTALRQRGIDTVGAFLAHVDPECPKLPTGVAAERATTAEIGNVLDRHATWLNRYVLEDRNQAFANNVCRELSRRNGTRALVLVGVAHTIRGPGWTSVQERLQQAGAVVIVADPPAVANWIANHPQAIATR